MCGIYGYVGNELAYPIILKGLKKLEYRGYDSWGITTLDNDFHTIKKLGCVNQNALGSHPGNVGIGHVRWATRGAISERNAHPHFDCKNEIAIVHNGVIFNEAHLRSGLRKRRHSSIISDTDTELFAHLLEENTNQNKNFTEDIYTTLKSVEAQYAFLILRKSYKKIYAVRNKSPIRIGIGNGGYHVSSDIVSFVGKVNEYMDLEDGDIAEIGVKGIRIYDSGMNLIERDLKPLNITPEIIDKGDYPYFYLKETEEIKSVIEEIIEKYVKGNIVDLGIDLNIFKGAKRIILTGAGSSYFASMVGEYYIRQLLGTVNVESVLSSELELKYADINFPQKTILIALTQSGETKDTNDAIEFAKQKGITVVSLVNKPYSEAEKISDFVIRLLANWETSVVATKTFVAELLVLLLLSISLSEDKKRYEILDEVKKLPDTLNTVFKKK
jgi:glucosamine--fructose-6-phosphate aminotransferase (isomerizing)